MNFVLASGTVNQIILIQSWTSVLVDEVDHLIRDQFFVPENHVELLGDAPLDHHLPGEMQSGQRILASRERDDDGIKQIENMMQALLCFGQNVHLDIFSDPYQFYAPQ